MSKTQFSKKTLETLNFSPKIPGDSPCEKAATCEKQQDAVTTDPETLVRYNLAQAYQFLGHLGFDDLTYTHLSARHPLNPHAFFINPFGVLFEEVTPETLMLLDLDGRSLTNSGFNKTGYRIHGHIYRHNPSLHCIMHVHTIAGVAVSALEQGLLPLSQFALHFYERLGIHAYDGLTLEGHQGEVLGMLFKTNPDFVGALLRHHGTLTVGTTIAEAFFYTYYLEKACMAQVATLSQGHAVVVPSADICRKARDQMRAFEESLGQRDWAALSRKYPLK